MHFLIDADSAMYKAGCSNEEREYLILHDGMVVHSEKYKRDATAWVAEQEGEYEIEPHKTTGPLPHSLANLKGVIERIIEHPKCTSWTVYIGGEGNFRYDIYEEYKASRDPLAKPLHLPDLKQYLIKRYGAVVVDGEEVDDRVSWEQCSKEGTCIASIDKDLLNTPGWNYNYGTEELTYVSQLQADLNFYRQLITGDKSVDNIPGLPRHGKAKALKALPESLPIEDMHEIVWCMYQELGFDWDYYVMNGQLLWMRREPNQMWQPPALESDALSATT